MMPLIHRIVLNLAKIYDSCDAPPFREKLERWAVRLAAGGFVLHLALIALARSIQPWKPGFLSELDLHFLHAVYTPFSFILFYEVLLLVLALPQSHTSSVGKQYEIVSLIVIRRVFKDIGEFKDPGTWVSQVDASMMVLMDMVAAAVMFLLVTLFYRIRKMVIRGQPPKNLGRFVLTKKAVAVLLSTVLITLAAYNLWTWAVNAIRVTGGESTGMDLDVFFFPGFFEFMIFTDVFLLIVSLPFFEKYEYMIRNAGFVISAVLLRFSLSTPKPYDLAVGLVAMLYGLCVLSVFAYFTRAAIGSEKNQATATTRPG